MKTSSDKRTLEQASCRLLRPLTAIFATLAGFHAIAAPIAPAELFAPKFEIVGETLNFTVQPSVAGRRYQIQYSDTLQGGTWLDLGGVVNGNGIDLVMTTPYPVGVSPRFFRLALYGASDDFALIPAGPFLMGDQSDPPEGWEGELPVHSVQVSKFYLGKFEVTKELWDTVRAWGLDNGYTGLAAGASKGVNHPVHSITWYDMVKWCNARSEKEILTPCYTVSGVTYKTGSSAPDCNWSASGYRLPTEAEWEKAARGGAPGKNFPWGTDTISHSQANYRANSDYSYDLSGAVNSFHPTYWVVGTPSPYSSPVGIFTANGYGLYDMAGNMYEWCWDGDGRYAADLQTDPRGDASGSGRVSRGGSWFSYALNCRVAHRAFYRPADSYNIIGFRLARSVP